MKRIFCSTFFVLLFSMALNQVAFGEEKVSSGVPIQGKIESGDKHTYEFKTNKDGEVYITLDQITGGFGLELYDANGDKVSHSYTSTRGDVPVINEKVAKGTYYVRIIPYSWSGITKATYRLKATYPGSIKRDTKTFEPNDTFETAMPIISKKLYSSSSFSYDDRDSYTFTTSKDGEVYITLAHITGGFGLHLYDVFGNLLDHSYTSTRGSVLRLNDYLSKGTYYVRITPYSWSGISKASYDLKAIYKDKTPSVNAISNRSTVITGKAYTNTTVYAKVGSKQIGKATAKKGKYSMKIKKQKAGTTISVYTIDKAGNQSTSKQVKVSKKK